MHTVSIAIANLTVESAKEEMGFVADMAQEDTNGNMSAAALKSERPEFWSLKSCFLPKKLYLCLCTNCAICFITFRTGFFQLNL